jgi:hypothetical protein
MPHPGRSALRRDGQDPRFDVAVAVRFAAVREKVVEWMSARPPAPSVIRRGGVALHVGSTARAPRPHVGRRQA